MSICVCNVYTITVGGKVSLAGSAVVSTPYALEYGGVKLGGRAFADVATEALDGVVAVWGLGEVGAGVAGEYIDSGPNGLHGTGGTGGEFYPGSEDGVFCLKCADFNASEYIVFPKDTMPATSAFTVSFWARLEDEFNQRCFFSRGSKQGSYDWVLNVGYTILGHLWARLNTTDGTTETQYDAFSSTTLAPYTWSHCACTWDRATLSVFINGVNLGSIATANDTTVTLGNNSYASRFNTGGAMTGQLQEIRLYAEAKDATWLKAERDNYCSSGFFTVGDEVSAV